MTSTEFLVLQVIYSSRRIQLLAPRDVTDKAKPCRVIPLCNDSTKWSPPHPLPHSSLDVGVRISKRISAFIIYESPEEGAKRALPSWYDGHSVELCGPTSIKTGTEQPKSLGATHRLLQPVLT
jgi:hypothetical protein